MPKKKTQSGVVGLSAELLPVSIGEIFMRFDAAGGAGFVLDRDLSLPVQRDVVAEVFGLGCLAEHLDEAADL